MRIAKDTMSKHQVFRGLSFTEDSHDIIVIDTKRIVSSNVVEAVYSSELHGQEQYESLALERPDSCKHPITDTIKCSNLPLP